MSQACLDGGDGVQAYAKVAVATTGQMVFVRHAVAGIGNHRGHVRSISILSRGTPRRVLHFRLWSSGPWKLNVVS